MNRIVGMKTQICFIIICHFSLISFGQNNSVQKYREKYKISFGTNFKFSITTDSTQINTPNQLVTYHTKCKIIYPEIALQNKIEGKVLVHYKLDKACEIDTLDIVKGLGYGLDEIAINCVLDYIESKIKNCEEGDMYFPINFRYDMEGVDN